MPTTLTCQSSNYFLIRLSVPIPYMIRNLSEVLAAQFHDDIPRLILLKMAEYWKSTVGCPKSEFTLLLLTGIATILVQAMPSLRPRHPVRAEPA